MSKLTNRKRKIKLTPKSDSVAQEVLVEQKEVETVVAVAPPVEVAQVVETATAVATKEQTPTEPAKTVTYQIVPSKPVKLNFDIDSRVAKRALAEVTDESHIGKHVSTVPTTEHTAIVTFESKMPGYQNWNWLVMLSWLDPSHLTIDEVAMVPTDDALIAPAWIPWSARVQAGDLGIGDELPYRAEDPALAPGYVAAEVELLDDQETLRPFWWSLGLGRERVLSATGRELAADRWSAGEFSGSAIMAKVAQGKCNSCGYFNPLAGSLGSAFGACTNAISPADGKVVSATFGCGAHSETDAAEAPAVPTVELVYDDTYDQGLNDDDDDNVDASEN